MPIIAYRSGSLARACVRRQPVLVQARGALGGGMSLFKDAPKDLVAPKQAPAVGKLLEWAKPLKIVQYPDPKLRALNAKVTVFDDALLELAKEMIKVMYADDGVGLAAPQVGMNIRMMVFNPYGREKPGSESILVNPEIISVSKTTDVATEGCLSFPLLDTAPGDPGLMYSEVERYKDIIVKAQNEKGEPMQLQLGGNTDHAAFICRIFQHEYDHLQGILFHDRMKGNALDVIREPLQALEAKYEAENPGVKIQRIPASKAKKGF